MEAVDEKALSQDFYLYFTVQSCVIWATIVARKVRKGIIRFILSRVEVSKGGIVRNGCWMSHSSVGNEKQLKPKQKRGFVIRVDGVSQRARGRGAAKSRNELGPET